MVDEAIKTKNICIIEKIEKENLRYAQKYAELQISKGDSRISSSSFFTGVMGLRAYPINRRTMMPE